MNLLITAGPTREHLDPVRFLSNRSTGKMGFALAAEATRLGWSATLVTGPVALPTPDLVRRVDVVSAREMLAAVQQELSQADVLIMCAAVADWRPAHFSETKLKKSTMSATLTLVPNPDILETLKPLKEGRIFVGFAAETGDPASEAQRKMVAKGLDMIVANDVLQADAGFAVDTNRVTLFRPHEPPVALPLMSKVEVARQILAEIKKMTKL